jgi:hypothetical protein
VICDVAKDPVLDSVRLLVAVGSFAAKPDLIGGLTAGSSITETLRKMAGAPPAGLEKLVLELSGAARASIAAMPNRPADAEVLLEQMIEFSLTTGPQMVRAQQNPEIICDLMLGKLTEVEHRRAPMPALFRAVCLPVLTRILDDPGFIENLMPAWTRRVSEDLEQLKRGQDQTNEMFAALLAKLNEDPLHKRELELQKDLVIALAERYAAGEYNDFEGAYRGLERALEILSEERAKGALLSNTDAAVKAILAKVDALNEEGRMDDGCAGQRQRRPTRSNGRKPRSSGSLTRGLTRRCWPAMWALPSRWNSRNWRWRVAGSRICCRSSTHGTDADGTRGCALTWRWRSYWPSRRGIGRQAQMRVAPPSIVLVTRSRPSESERPAQRHSAPP